MTCPRPFPCGGLLARALLCGGLLAACVDEAAPVPLAPLDPEHYRSSVEPYMARSCATLDCHGQGGRPLRLYSELGLRADDGLRPTALDEAASPVALTAAELEDNLASIRALEPDHRQGQERLLLTKPLARGAGGGAHVGGDLMDSTEADGYLCLAEWVSGDVDDPLACDRALEALQRDP